MLKFVLNNPTVRFIAGCVLLLLAALPAALTVLVLGWFGFDRLAMIAGIAVYVGAILLMDRLKP